jgi:hypothetical protein
LKVVQRGSWGKYSSLSMLLSTHAPCPSFVSFCTTRILFTSGIYLLCGSVVLLAKRNKSDKEENDKVKNKNQKEGKAQNASRP